MKKVVVFILSLLITFSVATPCQAAQNTIYISQNILKLEVKDTFQLLINLPPEYIVWSSNNTLIATVSDEGVVTAIGEGNTIITANIYGLKLQCSITVVSHTEVISNLSSDIYVLLPPYKNIANISVSKYNLSETKFSYKISNEDVVSCTWGDIKNNSLPLKFTAKATGFATVDVIAEFIDGSKETLTIYMISPENVLLNNLVRLP